MSWLALSASFEYLCYEPTVIINILILSVRGSTLEVSHFDVKVKHMPERDICHCSCYIILNNFVSIVHFVSSINEYSVP